MFIQRVRNESRIMRVTQLQDLKGKNRPIDLNADTGVSQKRKCCHGICFELIQKPDPWL